MRPLGLIQYLPMCSKTLLQAFQKLSDNISFIKINMAMMTADVAMITALAARMAVVVAMISSAERVDHRVGSVECPATFVQKRCRTP